MFGPIYTKEQRSHFRSSLRSRRLAQSGEEQQPWFRRRDGGSEETPAQMAVPNVFLIEKTSA
jgi:hypothetical protein